MTSRQSFSYGNDRIEYEIVFKSSKRTKIAIHVLPDAAVQVDAPEGESLAKIHAAVMKRARWIRRHVVEARCQRRYVLPRDYASGETVFYLGRRYQLKVKRQNGVPAEVKLLRGQVCVNAPTKDCAFVKAKLKEWYRDRAAAVFARRIPEVAERISWLKEIPDWRIVSMRKQWGSCSPAGTILLNPHLIKAPRECVDYVICHELCHLAEHNHSPRYYRLLRRVMPEWERVKARLDGMAELLLNE